jgi:hypothetical protein
VSRSERTSLILVQTGVEAVVSVTLLFNRFVIP